jgi:recombinational DNA repair protein RecT
MAKSFIRTETSSGGDTVPASPPQRPAWQSRNQQQEQPPQNYETAIVEALNQPTFISEIARILKDRNEDNVNPEDFVFHAVRQVQCADYDSHLRLVQCLPGSVQAAVRKLASMGLSPNAELGEGWLVARFNKRAGVMQATAVPGVRGMERKLMETGKVANIEARAIYLQDRCRVKLGTDNVIEHEINFTPNPDQPNPIIASYGIVTLKDGRREIAIKRLYAPGDKKPRQEEGQERGQAFMDEETAARYAAQRPAMKGALNKFFKEDRALLALIEMENQSYETAVNGDVAVRPVHLGVEPASSEILVPRAQIDDSVGGAISKPDPKQTQRLKHPVDEIVRQVQEEYQSDQTKGVRL